MKRTYLNTQKLCSLLFCFLAIFTLYTPTPIYAEESSDPQTVRTAFFDGSYIQENKDGIKSGYGYEFL